MNAMHDKTRYDEALTMTTRSLRRKAIRESSTSRRASNCASLSVSVGMCRVFRSDGWPNVRFVNDFIAVFVSYSVCFIVFILSRRKELLNSRVV